MSVWKRIKFAYKIYRGLIPAIWRSWRAPERLPPTREEVLEFMATGFGGKGVDLTPTCIGIKYPRTGSGCDIDIPPLN